MQFGIARGFGAAPGIGRAGRQVAGSAAGAVASGLAYAAWYAALPQLAAWRAALVQLAVPVVTALAAALVLNEAVTMRLLAALALVVGGLWLARR